MTPPSPPSSRPVERPENLQGKLEELRKIINQKDEKLKEANSSSNQLQTRLKELENQKVQKKSESKIQEENKKLSELSTKQKKTLKEKDKQIKKLQGEQSKLQQHYNSLREKKSKNGAEKILKENENLTQQLLEKNIELKQKQQEIEETKKLLEAANEKIPSESELEKQKKEKQLLRELQIENEQTKTKHLELTQKHEKLIEKMGELEFKLKDRKRKYEKKTKKLMEKVKSTSTTVSPRGIGLSDTIEGILISDPSRPRSYTVESPQSISQPPPIMFRSSSEHSPIDPNLYKVRDLQQKLDQFEEKKKEEIKNIKYTVLEQVTLLKKELERVRTQRSVEVIKLRKRVQELENSPSTIPLVSPRRQSDQKAISFKEGQTLLSQLSEGNFEQLVEVITQKGFPVSEVSTIVDNQGHSFLVNLLKIASALKKVQRKLQNDLEDEVKKERKRMEALMHQQRKELMDEQERQIRTELRRQMSRTPSSTSISNQYSQLNLPSPHTTDICLSETCMKERIDLQNKAEDLKHQLEDLDTRRRHEAVDLRKKVHKLEDIVIRQSLALKSSTGEAPVENSVLLESEKILNSPTNSEFIAPEDRLEQLLTNLSTEISNGSHDESFQPINRTASSKSFMNLKQTSKCDHCNEWIEREQEAVAACGKNYHSHHFFCSKCKKALQEYNFFELNKAAHCKSCYEQDNLPSCGGCRKPILTGAKTINALGKIWHTEHFVCSSCRTTDILNREFFPDKENNPYCRKCYLQIHGPRCPACQKPVTSSCVKACNSVWHLEHFVCETCRTPFGATGNYFEHEGKPYCKKHYYEISGVICSACSRPIQGRCLNALGKRWHPDCLACDTCQKPIKGKYTEGRSSVTCQACVQRNDSRKNRKPIPSSGSLLGADSFEQLLRHN